MYIQQADLTQGVGRVFVKELTAISVKETHEEGDFLFRRGDPANYAYLLLMGRDVYSTTAECEVPTKLRKLHKEDLQKLLEKDPANGLIFFQRLAGLLGERLLESYARYEKLFRGQTFV